MAQWAKDLVFSLQQCLGCCCGMGLITDQKTSAEKGTEKKKKKKKEKKEMHIEMCYRVSST